MATTDTTPAIIRSRQILVERPLLVLLALVILFWRNVLTTGTLYFRDLYLLFHPKRIELASALAHGRLPLWDAMTHGGQPFLATPSNTAFYPSNILFLILSPVAALNVSIVLQYLLCALFTYWLVRRIGLSSTAAFTSGALFTFAGVSLSAANLLPLLLALPWFPLTLGCVHLYLREGRRKWLTLAAISASMLLLAAAVELTAMMFLTILVWVLCCRYENAGLRRCLAAVIFTGGFAVALALCQILPATEVIANSARGAKRSYEAFSEWSLHPRRLPELVVPSFFGRVDRLAEQDYWGRAFESGGFPYLLSVYVGALALLLAAAGALPKRGDDRIPRRALGLLTLAGLLLSLGASLPFFHALWRWLPFFTIFRYPVKAILITLLPVSLLAGCSIDDLRRGVVRLRAMAVISAAIAVMASITGAIVLQAPPPVQRFLVSFFGNALEAPQRATLATSFFHSSVVMAAAAVVLFLPRIATSHRAILIAVIITADVMLAGAPVNAIAPRSFYDPPPAAALTRRLTGAGRFYHAPDPADLDLHAPSNDVMWLAHWKLEELSGYTAMTWGIPVTLHNDYDGLAPQRIVRLASLVEAVAWPRRIRVLQAAGVTSFMTTEQLRLPGVELVSGLQTMESHPVGLYQLHGTKMARFVSTAYSFPTDTDALKALFGGLPYESIALTSPRGTTHPCGSAGVQVTTNAPGDSTYVVDAPCQGWVALAENEYPGWETTVDSQPQETVRADYAFVAVPVTKGHHVIRRRYAPIRPMAGIASSLLALVALAISHWFGRKSP